MKLLQQIKWVLDRAIHLGGFGCSDTEHLLFEYIQDELTAETRQKLDKHLADCPGCLRYVQSYRKTIQATHEHGLPEVGMPLELQNRLKEFIRQNPELQ